MWNRHLLSKATSRDEESEARCCLGRKAYIIGKKLRVVTPHVVDDPLGAMTMITGL